MFKGVKDLTGSRPSRLSVIKDENGKVLYTESKDIEENGKVLTCERLYASREAEDTTPIIATEDKPDVLLSEVRYP